MDATTNTTTKPMNDLLKDLQAVLDKHDAVISDGEEDNMMYISQEVADWVFDVHTVTDEVSAETIRDLLKSKAEPKRNDMSSAIERIRKFQEQING